MDAAAHATSISKEYNSELYALHVIRADVDLFGPHETSEFMTRMRNEGEKYLNKVKLNANEKNIQIKTEIISFINIAGGILDYAEEHNIDLIVIGTRGRSGFIITVKEMLQRFLLVIKDVQLQVIRRGYYLTDIL